MLTISCPQCAYQMKAPAEFAGMNAKCRKCGGKFVVPQSNLSETDFIPIEPMQSNGQSPPPLPPKEAWHYAVNRERKGPVSRLEIVSLIELGTITRKTLVWSDGMDDWKPACETELRQHFQNTPGSPPPLTGDHVYNGWAWAIALVPLLDVLTLGALPFGSLFIVNTALCGVDSWRLRKAGHETASIGWIFLVPVYLFVRAKRANQRPDYAYVWILCFVVSILLTAPIFPVR
jgi:hypothetical protein